MINLKARPNDKCWTIQHVGCMLDSATCWKLGGGQTIPNIHSTSSIKHETHWVVRIFLSVYHIVTSTYVCNMAERKGRFKRCLSVLFVLDQLAMDSKTTREWLIHQYCSRTSHRRHASLSPDHENEIRALHGDIAIFVLVFFFARSLIDILRCFLARWHFQTTLTRANGVYAVSYTHLTLPTTPYV